MPAKKRILILTLDAGFGHRSAANAVAAAFHDKYRDCCTVKIVNPLDEQDSTLFKRLSQDDYDRFVRLLPPELYKLGYETTDNLIPALIAETSLVLILYDIMREMVQKYKPDAILTTNPVYQSPTIQYFDLTGSRIPFFTVVTDMVTAHRLWFQRKVDGIMVPNQQTYDLAVSYKFPPRKVHVTGIPVNPAICNEKRSRTTIRRSLGLDPQRFTILAVGSKRVNNLLPAINIINHFGGPVQLIVVSGKDDELYTELQNNEWHIPVKIYNFATNMAELLNGSDCVMTKAGGLIVTETMAAGLPMILIDVIQGQEIGNADFVVSNGAGDLADEPLKVLEVLSHWLGDNQKVYQDRKVSARRIGKPESAYHVADLLFDAAQRGPVKRKTAVTHIRNEISRVLTDIDGRERKKI